MRVTLVVKGTTAQALASASVYGIKVKVLHEVKDLCETVLELDEPVVNRQTQNVLSSWYGEPAKTTKGKGFPPGTLLLYTYHKEVPCP